MRTTKPLSTISYNTQLFLKDKLDVLIDAGKIEFYAYIPHLPEDDEAGRKDHFHVYVEPTNIMDSTAIRREFFEADMYNIKPKGTLLFQKSKFSDWYLYGLHDLVYLAMKNQTRVYHYSYDDFVYSDPYIFQFKVKSIDMTELTPYVAVQQAVDEGLTFEEFFRRGSVSPQQVFYFERIWQIYTSPSATNRNGRKGHDENYT